MTGPTLHWGECLEILGGIANGSLDALVTDPPAGIGFMGVAWDTYSQPKGSSRSDDEWDWTGSKERPRTADAQQRVTVKQGRALRAFLAPVLAEVYRVMKPGAHGLVWAIPRTSHWTAVALEDAGFEVRDFVLHHFGSGFPKSLDVSKAIDKAAGAERGVVSEGATVRRLRPGADQNRSGSWEKLEDRTYTHAVTEAATEAARRWEGWGTALKPATEVWWLVRKPLSEHTVASNVLAHGTGALNIDGCRVGMTRNVPASLSHSKRSSVLGLGVTEGTARDLDRNMGRWPANVILSHGEDCRLVGSREIKADGHYAHGRGADGAITTGLRGADASGDSYLGTETVETWECADGCAVAELNRQSGTSKSAGGRVANISKRSTIYGGGAGLGQDLDPDAVRGDPGFGDTGGASRFYYIAKASSRERNAGLPPGWRNTHPTVKPIALMRYLCRLVTPPGGVVLDPFMGSGSTGVAALAEGFGFCGIERDAESFDVAVARIKNYAELVGA